MKGIIDIHNHPNWHGHNIDRLVANMDKFGIEKTWLLSWELPEKEFNVEPAYHKCMDPRGISAPLWMVVEGLQKYPRRFIGGWAPDPRDRHARAKLEAAVNIHGIRIYGEMKLRMRYDDPDAICMYHQCAKLNLPVLFHLEAPRFTIETLNSDALQWPAWYGGTIEVVNNMCTLCPNTIFIGHGPGWWREISADADNSNEGYPSGPVKKEGNIIKLMRKHKNLYGDLSAGSGRNALARDIKHAMDFIHEFQDRLMFGRDYFDDALMKLLNNLKLENKIKRKLFYENAKKLITE